MAELGMKAHFKSGCVESSLMIGERLEKTNFVLRVPRLPNEVEIIEMKSHSLMNKIRRAAILDYEGKKFSRRMEGEKRSSQ